MAFLVFPSWNENWELGAWTWDGSSLNALGWDDRGRITAKWPLNTVCDAPLGRWEGSTARRIELRNEKLSGVESAK